MNKLKRIIQLLSAGQSTRSIAKETSISRNTVREYITLIHATGIGFSELLTYSEEQLSNLIFDPPGQKTVSDKRRTILEDRLKELAKELSGRHITRQLLWQEYRIEHPDGYGYSQFCYILSEYVLRQDVSMHFLHKPGEKLQVDFAGRQLSYINESGQEIKCQVFVGVLPFSGYTYIEAVHSQKQEDFLSCLENALKYIGGVPQCIVSDNLRSAVKRSDRYDPEFTFLMEQFSVHYNTSVMAARVAKPKDKPSVEKAVHLAYERVYAPLRKKQFGSLADLNDAIWEQLMHHHDRPFRRSEQSRLQLFTSEESSSLGTLPVERMEVRREVMAKVQRNYHVVLGIDWHYYSVPFQYAGKQVKIIYTQGLVEIYHERQRIAIHHRSPGRNHYTTLKEHMPPHHLHYTITKGWDADYFRSKAQKISDEVVQVINQLLSTRFFAEQTFTACIGILRLADKYGNERLSVACGIAIKARAVRYRFIHNILKNKTDMCKEEESSLTLFSTPAHENVRGPSAYQ